MSKHRNPSNEFMTEKGYEVFKFDDRSAPPLKKYFANYNQNNAPTAFTKLFFIL